MLELCTVRLSNEVFMKTYFRQVFLPVLVLAILFAFVSAVLRLVSMQATQELGLIRSPLYTKFTALVNVKVTILMLGIVILSFFYSIQTLLRAFTLGALILIIMVGFGADALGEHAHLPVFGFKDTLSKGYGEVVDVMISKWPLTTLVVFGKFMNIGALSIFLWGLLNQMTVHSEGKRFYLLFAFLTFIVYSIWTLVSSLSLSYMESGMQKNILLLGAAGALAIVFVLLSYLSSEDDRLVIEDSARIQDYLSFSVIAGIAFALVRSFASTEVTTVRKAIVEASKTDGFNYMLQFPQPMAIGSSTAAVVTVLFGSYVLIQFGSKWTLRLFFMLSALALLTQVFEPAIQSGYALRIFAGGFLTILASLGFGPLIYLSFTRIPKSIRFPLFTLTFLVFSLCGKYLIKFGALFGVYLFGTYSYGYGVATSFVLLALAYIAYEYILKQASNFAKG